MWDGFAFTAWKLAHGDRALFTLPSEWYFRALKKEKKRKERKKKEKEGKERNVLINHPWPSHGNSRKISVSVLPSSLFPAVGRRLKHTWWLSRYTVAFRILLKHRPDGKQNGLWPASEKYVIVVARKCSRNWRWKGEGNLASSFHTFRTVRSRSYRFLITRGEHVV